MKLLHNIAEYKYNSNYNTPQEVIDNDDLTFDGVYRSVYKYRDLLQDKNVILFVTGDYMGKDNWFDTPQPLEEFCNWNEVMELVISYGCKLGWHTWSHKNLTKLEDDELIREVTPPFPMNTFSYPYGEFDERVIEAVKQAGFKEAYSVFEGDASSYQRLRQYI